MIDRSRMEAIHVDLDQRTSLVQAADGANYARLVELKRKYDPDNFFHLNHNIVP